MANINFNNQAQPKRTKYLTQAMLPQSNAGDGSSLQNISNSFTDEIYNQDQGNYDHFKAAGGDQYESSSSRRPRDELIQQQPRQEQTVYAMNDLRKSDKEQIHQPGRHAQNPMMFDQVKQGRPSHAVQRNQQAMTLHELDDESDQVLLGSAFDDTRTVQATWNITQQPMLDEYESLPKSQSNVQKKEPIQQLSIVDEDEKAATQKVQEAWRRQQLLDDIFQDEELAKSEQEDEVAADYPVHERMAVRNSRRQQEQVNPPPMLGQMPKESSMSFGIIGQSQHQQNLQVPQHLQQQQPQQTLQSEDFYANNFTTKQSVANDASRVGQNFAKVIQAQTVESKYSHEQTQYSSGFETNQKLASNQGSQYTPSTFLMTGGREQMQPIDLTETPQTRNETRPFMPMSEQQLFTDKRQGGSYGGQMFYNEPQTEPRQKNFQQMMPMNFPMVRTSPPSQPMYQHQHQSSGRSGAEQFLTLDHFLNEQQSPAQFTELKPQKVAMPHPLQLDSGATPARQFQMESDAQSLRQHAEISQRRIGNFELQQMQQHSPRMASTSPLRVDPEEIKRRQQRKQQTLEMKRKQEIEALRQQARQREIQRVRKIRAAILIQKWVRGHLCRLEHARMRANFRYIRKLRRMLSIAYGRKKTRFIKQLVFMLQETGKKRQKEFQEEIGAFCATLIQKVWRGHHFRRVVKRRLLREFKSQRLLRALVQGYRTRSILYRTRECVTLRREINEILQQLRLWQHKLRTLHPATTTKQQHVQIKKSIAQLKEDRRVKVAQLIRAVAHLRGRGRWVHQLLPRQVPVKKVQAAQQHQRMLRQGSRGYEHEQMPRQFGGGGGQPQLQGRFDHNLFQQQNPGGGNHQQTLQLDNDLLFNEVQPSYQEEPTTQKYFGDEIENENSFVFPSGQQARKPQFFEEGATIGMHDETARNLIASVGGAQSLSPIAGGRAAGMIPKPAFLNDENPSNQVAQEDDLALMWPSQKPHKQDIQGEGDDLGLMWPSQQKKVNPALGGKSAVQTLHNRLNELNNDSSGDIDADDSKAEVAIVWPSANRMKGGMDSIEQAPAQRVVNQNSIVIQSKWTDNKPWDEQPVGGKAQNAGGWDEMPVGGGKKEPQWEEYPPGDPKWDDMPVGGGNKQPVQWDEQPVGGAAASKPAAQWDDQPVGGAQKQVAQPSPPLKEQNSLPLNRTHESSVISVAPPKIGLSEFELMIEKAMQADGKKAAQPAPPVNPNPPPEKPQNAAPAKKEEKKEEDPAKKKKQEEAAALLEKRKKYDPRKALKKGKKGAAKKAPTVEEEAPVPDESPQPELPKAKPVKEKPTAKVKEEVVKVEEEVKQAPPAKKSAAQPKTRAAKKAAAKPEPEETPSPFDKKGKDAQEEAQGDDGNAKKPKPFLKRKTKTMQPAKINWKAKSKLDCWNADSKETKGKREIGSPPQNNTLQLSEKTLIETQQELEQSMNKFCENQPGKLSLRKQQSSQPLQKEPAVEIQPVDDGEYDLETVPNEQINSEEEKKVLPQSEMMPNAAWKGQFLTDNGNKDESQDSKILRGGTFAQQRPQMSGRLPSQMKKPLPTEVDDFDTEPLPRQMMQQTGHNTARVQPASSRQPMKTPPDGDNDTSNYNTFSQPDFAQPGHQLPQLTMGQSMMQQEMQPGTGPFLREGESNLNISEIQAQVSSVMTHADVTSHGFGAFHFGNDGNQATEEGQANLQLEELQKVFDLFHTVVETVEEPVPSSSLSRLQARELPRPHGPNSRTGRQTSKKIERKTLKLHCFEEVQIEEVIGKDTCIPHLSIDRSVFFQSYSSDQFEEIFEDLKGHYKRLCDEEPDGGMDDDSQNMSQF